MYVPLGQATTEYRASLIMQSEWERHIFVDYGIDNELDFLIYTELEIPVWLNFNELEEKIKTTANEKYILDRKAIREVLGI